MFSSKSFTALTLKCRSMIHFELLFLNGVKVRVQGSYICRYLVVPVAKCWKNYSLGIFVENQLTRNVWFISELSIPTADLCKCFSFSLESSFPLALPTNSLPFTSQCPSPFLKEVFSEPYMLSQIHLLYVFILSVQCLKFWFTVLNVYTNVQFNCLQWLWLFQIAKIWTAKCNRLTFTKTEMVVITIL